MFTSSIQKVLTILIFSLISVTAIARQDKTGFLVISPDRGFMGNQEIRDLHMKFSEKYNSSLAIITPKETDRFLKEGIDVLVERGVNKLVVLPLFISDDHPLYKLAKKHLVNNELTMLPLEFSETMNQGYLTAELLADRITELSQDQSEESLVLVASGATNDAEKNAIKKDIEQLRSLNQGRFHFKDERILVFGEKGGSSEESLAELDATLKSIVEKGLRPVVVPVGLSQKADGMMSFSSRIKRVVQRNKALYSGRDFTPHELVGMWLARQANKYLPVSKDKLGVIFMPHGSDYNWNRRMMGAIEELQDDYLIEHAFSMGDPVLIERAVQKLEARGATAITVLRIFSLESSFRDMIEYTIGMRGQLGHGGHMPGMSMPNRVRSSSLFYSTGGLEDSPLFAEALLDRAIGLSDNPEKETIILVGHGTRTEEGNNRWLNNLESISNQMEKIAEKKGYQFRDFKYENWREDWPALREEAIANVRQMVKEASNGDGTAIVIPARTTKGGHAQRWLSDLDFKHNGEGFAPHPLFVQWVEGLIQESLDHFNNGKVIPEQNQDAHSSGNEHHAHK